MSNWTIPCSRRSGLPTEEVTGETVAGWGIDGCSAPNFAMSVGGLGARDGRLCQCARTGRCARQAAMHRLTRAMAAHPDLVAGEGRACTELMRAMGGRVAIKTGAEAVFVAILPEKGLGIALKVLDGATRASEAAIAHLLVRAGVLEAGHPADDQAAEPGAEELPRVSRPARFAWRPALPEASHGTLDLTRQARRKLRPMNTEAPVPIPAGCNACPSRWSSTGGNCLRSCGCMARWSPRANGAITRMVLRPRGGGVRGVSPDGRGAVCTGSKSGRSCEAGRVCMP